MKSLDLNNDGVIDFDEFKRWYFTGFQTYNITSAKLLKTRGYLTKAIGVLAEETKNALKSKDMKCKSSKFVIGYNSPTNP